MIVLSISVLLAVIAIFLIIYGLVKDNDASFAGWMILLFDLLLGFGLFCSMITDYKLEEKIEFNYAKTNSCVIIETSKFTQVFTDAATYNKISDSSSVYIEAQYNVYGLELRRYLVVK